jgi:hypothetical protein
MRSVSDLLDRPIAYHRVFVTLTGSVKAAILLSQAVYWQKRAKQDDGWWFKTAEEWEEETGLTRHEQDTARKACGMYLKTELRDAPARLYWMVDEARLSADLVAESSQSSLPETVKLDSRFPSTINRNTETTAETTTSGLSERQIEQANRKVDAIIEQSRVAKNNYPGRESLPEPIRELVDVFVRQTGIRPMRKKETMGWLAECQNWLNLGVSAADLKTVIEYASGKFAVTTPYSLTNTLRAFKAGKMTQEKQTRSIPTLMRDV